MHHISKLSCFSSHLAVAFVQSIEARCWVENEDVVGAAPTGDAPTISERSVLLSKVWLILEVWQYWYMFILVLSNSVCTMNSFSSDYVSVCHIWSHNWFRRNRPITTNSTKVNLWSRKYAHGWKFSISRWNLAITSVIFLYFCYQILFSVMSVRCN